MKKNYIEGVIGEFYTLNGYFLKVKPAFPIDKVCFSFVQKGQNGKGFDIYVDIDIFEDLCILILNKELKKAIEQDNGQYPNAWKYITGENASKTVAFGKGKNGIVCQGQVKGGGNVLNAFVPIAYYRDLEIMARWYQRVSAPYYEEISKKCYDYIMNSPYHNKEQEEKPQTNQPSSGQPRTSQRENVQQHTQTNQPSNVQQQRKTNQPSNVPSQGQTNVQPRTNENAKIQPQAQPTSQGQSPGNQRVAVQGQQEQKPSLNPNGTQVYILTTSLLTPYGKNGLCYLKGITQKNKEMCFVLDPKELSACNDWNNFVSQAGSYTNIKVYLNYNLVKDKHLVCNVKIA